jgi:hypothetical protein
MSDSGDDIESIISRLHIIESGTTADHCSVENYAWFSIGQGPRGGRYVNQGVNMTIFVEFFALSMIFILCVLVGIDQWSERHQYYAAADSTFLDEAYPRDEA